MAEILETTVEELVIKSRGREIYGKLYCPKREGKCPAIILSHGYNGDHSNWKEECEYYASKGIIAYAYDFCGGSHQSQSSGKSTDMTIFTEKEELLAVFDYIVEMDIVDSAQVYLSGASQGGLVTALAAEERADKVKGVILYFPALNIPDDWRRRYTTVEEIPEITVLWGLELSKKFFLEIRDFYTFEHIGKYANQLLIIHGDVDDIVPIEYSKKAIFVYPKAQLLIMPGEGHGYKPEAAKKAMERALEFMMV